MPLRYQVQSGTEKMAIGKPFTYRQLPHETSFTSCPHNAPPSSRSPPPTPTLTPQSSPLPSVSPPRHLCVPLLTFIWSSAAGAAQQPEDEVRRAQHRQQIHQNRPAGRLRPCAGRWSTGGQRRAGRLTPGGVRSGQFRVAWCTGGEQDEKHPQMEYHRTLVK